MSPNEGCFGKLKPAGFNGQSPAGICDNKAQENTIVVRTVNNIDEGLFVKGKIDEVPVSLLIDSGAAVTIIGPQVFERMHPSKKGMLRPTKWRVKAVNGESLPVRGQIELQLTTNNHKLPLTALLADIHEDGILGMDFLREAIIDCKERSLSLQDKHVPLFTKENLDQRPHRRVYIQETIELQENSDAYVTATLEEGSDAVVGIVGSCPSDANFAVEDAVVSIEAGNTVSLRLMNTSNLPIRLRKGTKIAHFEPVSQIRKVHLVKDDGRTPRKANEKRTKHIPAHLDDLFNRSTEFLTHEETKAVLNLLLEFSHVFSSGKDDIGRTSLVEHSIDTGDHKPIKISPRRLPLAKMTEAEKCVQQMEEHGIIKPSTSPWSAPIVLVKKKDNSTRFCVDYRMLNEATKKDSLPLPRIDVVLDSLASSSWFSTLDMQSGYWQVKMSSDSQEKTAFASGDQLWEFTVMPFGLCNSPATFSRLMNQVLQDIPASCCLKYLDDLVVHGTSFEGELQHLRRVLERLEGAGLKLNPKKCSLFQRRVHYLGHVVSKDGVATDPAKIEAVVQWPKPSNVSEVRSFLGLCSYYRRFVSGFADLASPLHALIRTPLCAG